LKSAFSPRSRKLAWSLIGLLVTGNSAIGGPPLYRWVDEQGKSHFSDKPPDNGSAADISSQLTPLNIGETREAQQRLKDVFRGPTDLEKAYKNQQAELLRRQQQELQESCARARLILSRLQGPVVFTDDSGQIIKVSEDERADRERQLAEEIAHRCD